MFCLQETNKTKIERIISTLFDTDRFLASHVTKYTDTDRFYSLHTIVRRPHQILASDALFAEDDADTGQALATTLRTKHGRSLSIVNIHGVPFLNDDKRDTEGRLRQTETVISWVQSRGNIPAVVCGDFNLLPDTKSIQDFTSAGFTNLIDAYDIPTTRNRLAWERYPDNIQLFADYVFTSPDIAVTDFTVPDIEVSDHLPMLLTVSY